jgi:hypothetical protein
MQTGSMEFFRQIYSSNVKAIQLSLHCIENDQQTLNPSERRGKSLERDIQISCMDL